MKKCIALCLLAVSAQFPANAQDYLSEELRASVERLKADVARAPSNQRTALDRTHVFWEWINAFAMTGRYIPVNATQLVSAIEALAFEGNRFTSGQLRQLDAYVHEFTVRDERPDAIGTLTISDAGPFIAESMQTLEVTYTVGEMDMEVGGAVLIARQFLSDAGFWQNSEPSRDNYVSIRSSNSRASFSKTTFPVAGMHGGFRGGIPMPAYRLQGTALKKGDTITLRYGDTSQGGGGMRIQTFSNVAAGVPVYIDFEGEGAFFSLPIPTYEVTGKAVHAIHGFAPSVVATGESFEVSVRAEDAYYNRASGPIPELKVLLNDEPYKTLPAGTEAIQLLSDITLDKPGVYRFSFQSRDGSVVGMSNPIWVQDDPALRIYWGETHGHCGFAEGQGTADGYFKFGRDDARLDFLTLSEHDIWLDDYEWQQLNALSESYTEEGKFIAYPGYEWTARRARGGHHNVFFRRSGMDRVPVQQAPLLTDLYLGLHAKYAAEDVLVIPHAHQLADWRTSDVYLEKLVEIMSMHGTFDWFGDRYLQAGHEVGFIAASDDHMSHPGYSSGSSARIRQRGGLAAVYSPELTTDAVFDGLRERNAYATSGARIILDAKLNGERMGLRQEFSTKRTLRGRVMGTAGIDTIALIKNGAVLETLQYASAATLPHSFLQVNFESESQPTGRDNPRGYRPWAGTLEVSGARLVGVSTPGFQDLRTEWARRDENNGNKIDFNTATRGRTSNIVLELEDLTDDTRIRFSLKQARENATAPIRVRPFATLPAAEIEFRVGDFENGSKTHEFQVERYRDHLTLRFIDPEISFDRDFEFVDNDNPMRGDYYYLRVRQLDGALAWSSPWWVGGESPR